MTAEATADVAGSTSPGSSAAAGASGAAGAAAGDAGAAARAGSRGARGGGGSSAVWISHEAALAVWHGLLHRVIQMGTFFLTQARPQNRMQLSLRQASPGLFSWRAAGSKPSSGPTGSAALRTCVGCSRVLSGKEVPRPAADEALANLAHDVWR